MPEKRASPCLNVGHVDPAVSVGPQDGLKKEIWFKPLLGTDQIDLQIKSEIDIYAIDLITLIDAILRANKEHFSLDDVRKEAVTGHPELRLEEGLLFRKNLLIVLDTNNL